LPAVFVKPEKAAGDAPCGLDEGTKVEPECFWITLGLVPGLEKMFVEELCLSEPPLGSLDHIASALEGPPPNNLSFDGHHCDSL
jgi:hypothetical protein